MSNNINWDDEDDDDTTDDAYGDGSDLLKKLRKAKRSDEKRIKELTEQLEGYSKVQRERIVKEVLEAKGINQKAQRLILKDLDEVTEESVNRWLEDNGDLFVGAVQPPVSDAELQNRAALAQQDAVSQMGVSPERLQDIEMRIASAKTREELDAILASQ
jgi:hypothetical protein